MKKIFMPEKTKRKSAAIIPKLSRSQSKEKTSCRVFVVL